ncbi:MULTISPECIES: hypothetical protein [Pseudanabaena]|uniref:hypothetical protein n=1 Tax=Pseudanabaena TaxID=1152 RepID=UPI002478D329|nr:MULTISPECIES: hypothetical protein [Pseudanabaena]MEA5487629.1 hypothetical protein [Pseudanabaena sp. CCNP1317]WGS75432.1 hypothetical protein OA858_26080 [Pseudanabaena galeata CCNP1313]
MSTSEELEKITDTSSFELLATAVLCKAEKDYRAILHSGLNAQGQPRKSPVDGFCRVHNSNPPHFILVEHTVESKLSKKWLFDHRTVTPSKRGRKMKLSESDDGDLLKAGQLSSTYKAEFPDARFTVVLTTNQGLQPDFCLEVEKKAKELGVSVDFWDRSRIARFLDTETEGQWLRKEYLGIEAEILSENLLRNLCNKSLEQYQKQFLTSPDRWVSRHIDQQVEKAVENQNCSISLLIGNSGSGKSAAAYQVGKKHLEAGEYSLWLSENVLGSSDSLENALDKALHDLYPSLMSDAGNAALKLLKDGKRLLLIADDVNRTNSPANLLQKLINWSKPSPSQDSNTKTIPSKQLLICPVWSDIVGKINLNVDKTTWISSVFVGTMSAEEGLEAVKDALLRNRIELTNAEITILAENLGNDPILIGLFDDLLPKIEHSKLSQVAENAIDSFISNVVENVVGNLFPNEYRSALLGLTTQMLIQRRFNPTWSDIKNWLANSSEELQALRRLAENKKLCKLEGEKLVFRHDRIREFLLVGSMGQLLNENASEPLNIFWEPYYAEIIGQAIIQYPQSEEFLQELCDQLPLALVEALKYPNTTENYLKIVEKVKNWLCKNTENSDIPELLLDAVYSSLMKVNSPLILEITENLAPNAPILLARLRNGCTRSGIRYLAHCNRFIIFAPMDNDSRYNEVLSHVSFYYKIKLLSDLKQALNSYNVIDSYRDGALTLAGFLEYSELENDLIACWQLSKDKSFTLGSAIWAASRCCKDESLDKLESLLVYWSNLNNSPENNNQHSHNWFSSDHNYRTRLSHQFGSHFIQHFISQAKKHESLGLIFANTLNCVDNTNIDNADIIEHIIREISNFKQNDEKSKNLKSLVTLLSRVFMAVRLKKHKLSKSSMDRLKCLWQNTDNNDEVREKSSQLWVEGANYEQIDDLKKITDDFPFFYEALQKRIQLGDYSVIKDAYSLFSTNARWLHLSHHIWCNDLMAIVEKHLQVLKNIIPKDFSGSRDDREGILSELLTLVPINDAELILERHWSYIGYSPRFIQAAIYIGTPKCLALADSRIRQCSNHTLIFKYLVSSFYIDGRQHLRLNHLERLIPYLDCLEESELWLLETICQKFKAFEWGKQHLKNRHSKKVLEEYYPSDNQLLQELDDLSNHEHGILDVLSWTKKLEQRHTTHQEALTLLESWLASNPIMRNYRIVCEYLKLIGSRQNLSLLEKYKIVGSPTEVNQIKMDTQFAVYRRTLE